MSEGLKALERSGELWATSEEKGFDVLFKRTKDYKTIEKELKQAEENEEMLNIFKNALTIERKPINNTYTFKRDRENYISYLASEIIEIKQNELDNKLRSNLREWVLKNAFTKELKALEIIKVKLPPLMRSALLDYCNKEEYDLLKEVLL